ncbi:MAG: transcription termination factor NusA [Patescibacteria group bacterium]|nr:transcription termination factor NusA [Patescibacteria group bacterium]
MDMKNFASAIAQIAEEKGISSEKVFETIEQALAAAYKKDYGQKGQIIKAELDSKSGEVKFWQVKTVVDEKMIYSEEELEELKEKKQEIKEDADKKTQVRFNEEKHIMIDEAKKIKAKIKPGEELIIPLEPREDYGRIAAQTAKQVIMQRIREAEKESIFDEYKSKEGEIISGIVQRVEGKSVFFDIGKTLGVLSREEQVPGEFYRPGQRLKLYILKVEITSKGPRIFLSRAYPKLVSKLFELEVPEISSGSVEIKSIAREAGSRTKIAVLSLEEGVDPIGAVVGQRGTRVQVVINELGGEKIDIIEYSDDPETYISNSLSPAKVEEIKIMPKNTALAVVPHGQLSLAIGKNGQNVRLAAKLTGWKIDVRGPSSEGTKIEKETEKIKEKSDKKKKEEKKKEKNSSSAVKEKINNKTLKKDKE